MRIRSAACLAVLTLAVSGLFPAAAQAGTGLGTGIGTGTGTSTSASTGTGTDTVIDHPVLSLGCFRQTDLPLGQTVTGSVTSGGVVRTYRIHLPANYRSYLPTPVIMTFGGRGESSTTIEGYSDFDDLNAIAVYPDGLPGEGGQTAWEGAPYASTADDVLFVSDLLNQLQSTLCVDPLHIYADGKSNGGGFAALLACQMPGRIAAFGMVAGAFYPGTSEGCQAGLPVSLVDFHGTADTVIAYDGNPNRLGSTLPAVMDWVAGWGANDACNSTPISTDIGTDVVEFDYYGCADRSSVVHYRVVGGGHTWPGATIENGPGVTTLTISATKIMWQFFLEHPLNWIGCWSW